MIDAVVVAVALVSTGAAATAGVAILAMAGTLSIASIPASSTTPSSTILAGAIASHTSGRTIGGEAASVATLAANQAEKIG